MQITPRTHPRLADLPRNLFLRWCGPEDVAKRLHLQPGHPGFLLSGDEEGVLINWTDADGTLQYNGTLQANWLEVITDQEHQQAGQRLSASSWSGFPVDDEGFMAAWHAEPHPYHRLDRLPMFSYVRWCGPDDAARRLSLQPGHPGFLLAADETHALINWTDKRDVLQYNGRLDPNWLRLISEDEHRQAGEELRASSWDGFPWDDNQAMAAWIEQPWILGGEAFPAGTRVLFTGSPAIGDPTTRNILGLQPEHPGTVMSSGEKHAIVYWVDAVGVFTHEGVAAPEWLKAIDEEDYQRRAQTLRDSGWRWVYYNEAADSEEPGPRPTVGQDPV